MTREDHEEAALAPFIAAARADEPPPRVALIDAILADAAEVAAARRPVRRARRWRRWRALLEPIGGWPAAAALGLCAGLGFWLGMSDEVTIGGAVWTGAAIEPADDPVAAFFDLAAVEG